MFSSATSRRSRSVIAIQNRCRRARRAAVFSYALLFATAAAASGHRAATAGAPPAAPVAGAGSTAAAGAGVGRATISVDEIRPGMKGFGLSVFSGTRIDTFQVEVLDVRRNFMPQGDVILALGSGAGLEQSGIIAGMSGSPVYIEGRLAGALAYGWPYQVRPIMGITPIEQMLPMATPTGATGSPGQGGAATPERRAAWRSLLLAPPVDRLAALDAVLRPAGSSPEPVDGAGRLQTPLWLGGAAPSAGAMAEQWFRPWSLMPLAAGQGGASGRSGGPGPDELLPGAAIGVVISRGDFAATAIGTVTWRQGDRVLAFGHPMFQGGLSRLPMATATIETVMPRVSSSFKLGSAARTVGTIDLDMSTGIGGSIGPSPAMIPVTIEVTDEALPRGSRTFRSEVLSHEQLTPLLAFVAASNSLLASGIEQGETVVDVESRFVLRDGRELRQRHRVASNAPASDAAVALARPIGLLLQNPFETVELASVEASITIRHRMEQLTLEEVVVRTADPRPGRPVVVDARLRNYRGAIVHRSLSLDLPADLAPGDYRLRVASGASQMAWDQNRAPGLYEPADLGRVIDMLAAEKPEDLLTIALVRPGPGVTAGGRELGHLPPSVFSALAAPGVEGPFALTLSTVAATADVRLDAAVGGGVDIPIRLDHDPRGRGLRP